MSILRFACKIREEEEDKWRTKIYSSEGIITKKHGFLFVCYYPTKKRGQCQEWARVKKEKEKTLSSPLPFQHLAHCSSLMPIIINK